MFATPNLEINFKRVKVHLVRLNDVQIKLDSMQCLFYDVRLIHIKHIYTHNDK